MKRGKYLNMTQTSNLKAETSPLNAGGSYPLNTAASYPPNPVASDATWHDGVATAPTPSVSATGLPPHTALGGVHMQVAKPKAKFHKL